jgi:hypothetical protein
VYSLQHPFAVVLQACDESLTKQSALQLAHRQQVAELEDAVHSLRQQVCQRNRRVVLQCLPYE